MLLLNGIDRDFSAVAKMAGNQGYRPGNQTVDQFAERDIPPEPIFPEPIRKLPRQGDSVKGELPTVWRVLNSDGGIPSNVSWGRSSLYSRIHSALISRT